MADPLLKAPRHLRAATRRWWLEVVNDWALEAPVTGVAVQVVERVALSGEQGDLLHTGWRDPAAAEAA